MEANPLILTLSLDQAAADFFSGLRKRHFPPERNFLAAHLTLFHHLPPHEPTVIDTIRALSQTQQTLSLQVSGLMHLGRGVAFAVNSSQLQQLHRHLQHQWLPWLLPQDRQKLRPHITIQNKVSPDKAKSLAQQLSETFHPFVISGTGLDLWEYRGGPWQHRQSFPFQPSATEPDTAEIPDLLNPKL